MKQSEFVTNTIKYWNDNANGASQEMRELGFEFGLGNKMEKQHQRLRQVLEVLQQLINRSQGMGIMRKEFSDNGSSIGIRPKQRPGADISRSTPTGTVVVNLNMKTTEQFQKSPGEFLLKAIVSKGTSHATKSLLKKFSPIIFDKWQSSAYMLSGYPHTRQRGQADEGPSGAKTVVNKSSVVGDSLLKDTTEPKRRYFPGRLGIVQLALASVPFPFIAIGTWSKPMDDILIPTPGENIRWIISMVTNLIALLILGTLYWFMFRGLTGPAFIIGFPFSDRKRRKQRKKVWIANDPDKRSNKGPEKSLLTHKNCRSAASVRLKSLMSILISYFPLLIPKSDELQDDQAALLVVLSVLELIDPINIISITKNDKVLLGNHGLLAGRSAGPAAARSEVRIIPRLSCCRSCFSTTM